MDNMEFVVQANTFGGANVVPPCCVARPGWLMADPDATYGFKIDTIFALLSTYVEALLCNPAIIVVGIPLGKSLDTSGIVKLGI